jgi:hypothetical protein
MLDRRRHLKVSGESTGGTAVKSLLNRRSVLAGPSHLVQIAREHAAGPVSPDESEEAALAAAGVTPAVAPADPPPPSPSRRGR